MVNAALAVAELGSDPNWANAAKPADKAAPNWADPNFAGHRAYPQTNLLGACGLYG